jgi:hypothetical protein
MAPERVDQERRLRRTYAAFNARDLDAALAEMSPEVDWPNAWEGGRVHGREAVRAYWTRQWASIDPTVEPVSFEVRPDGRVAALVHQVVRAPDGTLLHDGRVLHVYSFEDDLLARMEVEEPPATA